MLRACLFLGVLALAGCATTATTQRVGSLKDALRDARVERSNLQLEKRALITAGAAEPQIVEVDQKLDRVKTQIDFLETELGEALDEAHAEREVAWNSASNLINLVVGTIAMLGLGVRTA